MFLNFIGCLLCIAYGVYFAGMAAPIIWLNGLHKESDRSLYVGSLFIISIVSMSMGIVFPIVIIAIYLIYLSYSIYKSNINLLFGLLLTAVIILHYFYDLILASKFYPHLFSFYIILLLSLLLFMMFNFYIITYKESVLFSLFYVIIIIYNTFLFLRLSGNDITDNIIKLFNEVSQLDFQSPSLETYFIAQSKLLYFIDSYGLLLFFVFTTTALSFEFLLFTISFLPLITTSRFKNKLLFFFLSLLLFFILLLIFIPIISGFKDFDSMTIQIISAIGIILILLYRSLFVYYNTFFQYKFLLVSDLFEGFYLYIVTAVLFYLTYPAQIILLIFLTAYYHFVIIPYFIMQKDHTVLHFSLLQVDVILSRSVFYVINIFCGFIELVALLLSCPLFSGMAGAVIRILYIYLLLHSRDKDVCKIKY